MELIDWITLVFFFSLGWFFGSRASTKFHLTLFKMILQDLGISNKDLIRVARKTGVEFITNEQEQKFKEIEEGELDHIEIKVEKHGEMLYAFRNDNDQFLGQGTSREALIEAMATKLKNVRLTVVEGNEYMKQEA